MTSAAKSPYAGHRFPGEVISHAVWLYFRFPLSLRMVEEMLAARGIDVSHETVRQWGRKFGQDFANQIRRKLPSRGSRSEPSGDTPQLAPRARPRTDRTARAGGLHRR
jgi:putative transposase